ncbi:5283_t:CDS:2 [Cetraspora pellucida]|uniref:5283_t:CDS:1 n=1 Tax=Cetraspora pellucida TaxID=1433469 RepID=A0A9N9E2Y5_9GLOM|nr:5283_t:CDS:2 [Cetraspora pellucida]
MESTQKNEFKILLLGMTGAGKSTLINQLTNYFKGGDPQNLKIAIPTEYLDVTENEFTHSEKDIGDESQSKTRECQAYSFIDSKNHNDKFTFIDTPGLSDVDGVKQDEKNIEKIINIVLDVERLSAIAIVANGTETRFTSAMKNALTQLSNNLPDTLINDNLLLILTKCRKNSASLKRDKFFAKPKEEIHMDNSAFCSDPQTLEDPEALSDTERDWKKSNNSIEKLLNTIKTMPSIPTTNFKEIQVIKNSMKIEIDKLSRNIDIIQKVQNKLDESLEKRENASNIKKKFIYYIENDVIYTKKFVEVDYKNTYCSNHMDKGIICHKNCGVEYEDKNTNDLQKCFCMLGNSCKECGCGYERHFQWNQELKTELPPETAESLVINKNQFKEAIQDYQKHSSDIIVHEKELHELDSKVDNSCNLIDENRQKLRKLCARFNFVNEFQENIDIMKRCATTINNSERGDKIMNFIKKLEQLFDDRSIQSERNTFVKITLN